MSEIHIPVEHSLVPEWHLKRVENENDRLRAELASAQQAMDYLCIMFDLYENGTPCTEDGEDGSVVGVAIQLDEADFQSIADLLNKHRPVIDAARAK